jgi:hypothetical protein
VNILRVESFGSVWEIDLSLNRYRRYPREERPREREEWSDERAGALQDFVWHPISARPFVKRVTAGWRMFIPVPEERIYFEGRGYFVTAPLEESEAFRVAEGLG